MSKIKNILISILHVAVIAAIILFILIGLGRIGLLEFPGMDFLLGKKSLNICLSYGIQDSVAVTA